MAVSASTTVKLYPYGQSAEMGSPDGWFGAAIDKLGDATGGSNTLNVDMPVIIKTGRLYIIRRVMVAINASVARLFKVTFRDSDFTREEYLAAALVAGHGYAAAQVLNTPFVYKMARGEDNAAFVTVTLPNTDTETATLSVFGEFYEESRLRRLGIGPLWRP
jgi:hypothetical protein